MQIHRTEFLLDVYKLMFWTVHLLYLLIVTSTCHIGLHDKYERQFKNQYVCVTTDDTTAEHIFVTFWDFPALHKLDVTLLKYETSPLVTSVWYLLFCIQLCDICQVQLWFVPFTSDPTSYKYLKLHTCLLICTNKNYVAL